MRRIIGVAATSREANPDAMTFQGFIEPQRIVT
jgi:hypothetical protein